MHSETVAGGPSLLKGRSKTIGILEMTVAILLEANKRVVVLQQ